MTKEEVAELIEQIKEPLSPEDFLVALATKAEEAEREACAQLLENHRNYDFCRCTCECAAAIRARGQA